MKPKQCPSCALLNPISAICCDCGYKFLSKGATNETAEPDSQLTSEGEYGYTSISKAKVRFCPQCGGRFELGDQFCSQCGTSRSNAPAKGALGDILKIRRTQPSRSASMGSSESVLGTKWLKFWTYISLPIAGVSGILSSLAMPKVAMLFMPFAILQLVTAVGLHHREMWAWRMNWVIVCIGCLVISIPQTSVGPIKGIADFALIFTIRFAMVALVWMWPNYVYWIKRKALFASGPSRLDKDEFWKQGMSPPSNKVE